MSPTPSDLSHTVQLHIIDLKHSIDLGISVVWPWNPGSLRTKCGGCDKPKKAI